MTAPAAKSNLAAGLVAALVGALLGAVAWAVIVSVTDYKIGFAAVGVGALAGFLAGRAGGAHPSLPVAAAVIGLVGCVVGDLLIDAHAVAKAAESVTGSGVSMFRVLKEMALHPSDTGWPIYKTGFEAMDALFYAFAAFAGFRLATQHGQQLQPAVVPPPPAE